MSEVVSNEPAEVDPPGFLDKVFSKALSRKLTVFILGTVFFVANVGLTADDWMSLALMYLGTQGLVDIVTTYKHGKS